MADMPVIEAEFVVVDPSPEMESMPQGARWTFWEDDFPRLAGLAAALGIALVLRIIFRHH